jgi:hypothetical protein
MDGVIQRTNLNRLISRTKKVIHKVSRRALILIAPDGVANFPESITAKSTNVESLHKTLHTS